jgi:membrane-associated phospholipid phosphatase
MENLFNNLETGGGLQVVSWLQAHSGNVGNALAVLLYYLGGYVVYLILFLMLYWSADKKLARRFLMALLLSGLIIGGLKLALGRPRPYMTSTLIYQLTADVDNGFPSGHVGITLPVWGVLVDHIKKRWAWWLLALYITLLGWSRMVAGVHYPQDIIGGVLIGMGVLWWTLRHSDGAAARWRSLPLALRVILLTVAAMVVAFLLWREFVAVVLSGAIVGLGLGFIIDDGAVHFSPAGTNEKKIARILLGVVFVLGVLYVLVTLAAQVQAPVGFGMPGVALASLAAVAVYPFLCVRLGLAGQEAGLPESP